MAAASKGRAVKPGTYAQGPGGAFVQWDGAKWNPVPAPTHNPFGLSSAEESALGKYNDAAEQGKRVLRDYSEAMPAIEQLNTGPWRGLFLDAAIPQEDGNILDTIGGIVIGGPARLLGALDDETVKSYNNLKRVQSRRVLAEQAQQKGVQTEGDAARIKAGDISPRATVAANTDAASRGQLESQLLIDRAAFMAKWARKHGLYNVNERGLTAEQAFEEEANVRRKLLAPAKIEELK